MKIGSEEKLSSARATIILVNYILAAGILTLPRTSAEKLESPDVWITVILGGLFAMCAGVIIVKLSQRYPGRTFFIYSQEIAGKWAGSFLSLLMVTYFFSLAAYEVRVLSEVTSLFLLEGTPIWAIIMPFMWIGLYLITGGIDPIARLFELILPITVIIFLIVISMSIGIFELDNLRPVLGSGITPIIKGVGTTVFAFLGIEIMLVIVALMDKPSQAVKVVLIGTGTSMCFYLITVVMVIGALSVDGVLTKTWPTIDLIRSFEIQGLIFERFESLLLIIWIMQIFTTFTITFYAASLGLSQVFKKNIGPIQFALLPVIYLIGMIPVNMNEVFAMGDLIGVTASLLFVVLPLALLIISKIKGVKA
ncbi:spore germination protein [Bacillus sp. 7894-2]|uniref:spore germination protein n=1 Tax=Bacillus sp. 7894-2 TaxID=2021695 RepID=UPI000BA5D84F|nr:spore germination protein [Bacillus sp. 7894-2]PAE26151.1 spore gernimation protein [Bacillus sp. 7894-2]